MYAIKRWISCNVPINETTSTISSAETFDSFSALTISSVTFAGDGLMAFTNAKRGWSVFGASLSSAKALADSLSAVEGKA